LTVSTKKIKEGFVGQKMIVLPPNIKRAIQNHSLIRNFYLTDIGFYPSAIHHHRERRQGIKHYILIYCTEGQGQVFLNTKEFTLSPNTYFIIPKNVSHSYKSSETEPWSIYWAHFSGEYADDLYKRTLIDDQPKVHAIPFDENRINLFDQIYSILEHSHEVREMEILNFNFLHLVTSMIYYKQTHPSIYDADATSNSIAYMKTCLHETFTIKQLAQQQNISVSHYSRIFKQKTGSSPIHYFNQLKVQKSCQYLYFSDRSIKEISSELGFDDPYYFSRLFKKFIGVSPAKYKLTHRKF
jgi:AraC family transcriptional regulator, arabinose operon regulatory protein